MAPVSVCDMSQRPPERSNLEAIATGSALLLWDKTKTKTKTQKTQKNKKKTKKKTM
jgi:hypothetical protein